MGMKTPNQPGFRGICLFFALIILIVTPAFAQTRRSQAGNSTSSDATSDEGLPPDTDAALYAVGSLSASNLYLSYLVLGTVADAYSQAIYDEEVAASLTNEAMYMNTNAQKALEQLLRDGRLADEDSRAVQRIARVYTTLTREAESLILFITNKEDTGEDFQRYRQEAWQQISELLGLSPSVPSSDADPLSESGSNSVIDPEAGQ